MGIGKPIVVLIVVIAVLALLGGIVAGVAGGRGAEGGEQAVELPEKTELKYPNLGSALDERVTGVEEGSTSTQGAAAQSPAHRGGSVAVTIHVSGSADEVAAFLKAHGGDPRNVGEDYVEAYVPVTLLGPVSEQPGVIRVREIVPPEDARSR